MKKFILILTSILSFIIIWACSDLEHTNPFDPDYGKPDPLTKLEISIEKIDRIKIIWDDDYYSKDSNYTFQLDRKLGDEGIWQDKYKIFTQKTRSFTDSFAGINMTNSYRMRVAYDENYSTAIERSVPNPFIAPANISVVRKDINTIQLNWSDNSNGEAGFKIDRFSSGEWTDDYAVLTENTETWTDSTVALNDSLQYRICAFKGDSKTAQIMTQIIENNIPAPSNFKAEILDLERIKISWTDNSIGEQGFMVDRKIGTGAWTSYYTAPADSTEWIDHNQVLNETMQYRIYAYKEQEKSDYIESAPLVTTFPAPSNLYLNQMDITTIRLDWSDNSDGEDGFKIDKKDATGTWILNIQTIGSNTQTWTDTAAAINDSLAYRVRAYKGTAFSSYSTATMNDINFPPPSNLTWQRINLTRIKFNWSDNSTGEEGYIIDKKVNEGEWIISCGATEPDATTWTDSLITVNQTVQYRVYGKSGSNYSNYAVSEIIDNTIPAPTNLTFQKIDINSIKLNWTDNSLGEDGFIIAKFVNDTWSNSYAAVGANITQWTDNSAEINENILYRISAYYSASYSNTIDTGVIVNTFPAPTNLTADVNGMSITLSWKDNSTGEQGFKIEKKYDGGIWNEDYKTVAGNIITFNETVADTGKYYYRVKAYLGTDLSAVSAVAEGWALQMENPMILVPAGTFQMGQVGVAEPVHEVTITHSFYMAKYETTQKEWFDIMGSNPASGYGEGDNFPVYNVSWYSVLVYCNKRSIAEGLDPCYKINNSTNPNLWGSIPTSSNDSTWNAVICNWYENGYRLPTEAEWEYAAKGGLYIGSFDYCGSNSIDSVAWYENNNEQWGTKFVGSKAPNQLGIFDMSGNVYEWCWDWWDYPDNDYFQECYNNGTTYDPTGPNNARADRANRGGYWNSIAEACRIANRKGNPPNDLASGFGFRVARNISTLEIPLPTNLSSEVNGFEITLNWIDNSNGEDGFKIDRKIGDGTWVEDYAQVGENIVTWNETVADTGKYYYRVKAYIGNDESGVSNETDVNINAISFIKIYGDSLVGQSINAVKHLNDGGYISVGNKSNGSDSDIWIFKADSIGNILWEKTYNSLYNDYGYDIEQTIDGGFIITGSEYVDGNYGDIWLIKTDTSGNMTWNKEFKHPWYNASDDIGYSVKQTTDGGYIIAGTTKSNLDIYYYNDFWLIKTDSSGNTVWIKSFGIINDVSSEIAYSVQQTTDGGYIIAGTKRDGWSDNPTYDLFIVKTDSDGNKIWEKTFGDGSLNVDFGKSVIQTSDGGYAIAGYSNASGSYKAWLLKINSIGNQVFSKTYGGVGTDKANSVRQTSEGGFIIAGETDSFGSGDYDTWVIKTDENGNLLWEKTYFSSVNEWGKSIDIARDGGYIIGGATYGQNGFGAGFLIKTDENGNAMGYTK